MGWKKSIHSWFFRLKKNVINYDIQENMFEPGDLVRWWITKKSRKIVYVYMGTDPEDQWMAVLLGPEGFTKARYVQLESL